MKTPADLEQRYVDLVRRNQGRIKRLCRAWTRTHADLEDLRSEVLLQLWRSLSSFDGRAGEDTWLYRVALNTAMLFGRREGSRKSRLEAFERDRSTPEAPQMPSESLEDRERLARLTRALSELTPADRAVIMLYLEDLSYREIAEVTGLSESHVGVRLHRIKKQLARLLDGTEENDHGTA